MSRAAGGDKLDLGHSNIVETDKRRLRRAQIICVVIDHQTAAISLDFDRQIVIPNRRQPRAQEAEWFPLETLAASPVTFTATLLAEMVAGSMPHGMG